MKSVRITFRLSPYQLARGLQTIRNLEPSYKLISINDMVKTIYHDYLAKMSLNKGVEVPSEIIDEITSFEGKHDPRVMQIDELMNITQQHPVPEPKTPATLPDPPAEINLTDEILAEINNLSNSTRKASAFNDPNETESDISSLTDFSPPKDWIE